MATLEEVLAAAGQMPPTQFWPPLESMGPAPPPPGTASSETMDMLRNAEVNRAEAAMLADWYVKNQMAQAFNDPVRAAVPGWGEVVMTGVDALTDKLGVPRLNLTDKFTEIFPQYKPLQMGLRMLPGYLPESAQKMIQGPEASLVTPESLAVVPAVPVARPTTPPPLPTPTPLIPPLESMTPVPRPAAPRSAVVDEIMRNSGPTAGAVGYQGSAPPELQGRYPGLFQAPPASNPPSGLAMYPAAKAPLQAPLPNWVSPEESGTVRALNLASNLVPLRWPSLATRAVSGFLTAKDIVGSLENLPESVVVDETRPWEDPYRFSSIPMAPSVLPAEEAEYAARQRDYMTRPLPQLYVKPESGNDSFFGPFTRTGSVASTFTAPVGRVEVAPTLPVNLVGWGGRQAQIPVLVPTLTWAQYNHLRAGYPITEDIAKKAEAFAASRIRAGRSVWPEPGEVWPLPEYEPFDASDSAKSALGGIWDFVDDPAGAVSNWWEFGNELAGRTARVNAAYAAETANAWGYRPDGTPKGAGYFGSIPMADGQVMTEMSVGVNLGGRDMEIPTIVSTSTRAELDYLAAGNPPTDQMVRKAVNHALMRMSQGKSVWAGPEDLRILEYGR